MSKSLFVQFNMKYYNDFLPVQFFIEWFVWCVMPAQFSSLTFQQQICNKLRFKLLTIFHKWLDAQTCKSQFFFISKHDERRCNGSRRFNLFYLPFSSSCWYAAAAFKTADSHGLKIQGRVMEVLGFCPKLRFFRFGFWRKRGHIGLWIVGFLLTTFLKKALVLYPPPPSPSYVNLCFKITEKKQKQNKVEVDQET